jgi:hypothetical protein
MHFQCTFSQQNISVPYKPHPMRLTRFSDIGLRVLIYLERAGERPHPVTVAKIGAQ